MDRIATSSIKTGNRLREDLGDIDSLAESIKSFGLFHPVVIDNQRQLVAGQRRLEACRRLGMKRIEVRLYGELTETERREIEFEENVKRKNLTEFEKSKRITCEAEVADEILGDAPKKDGVGRPRKRKATETEIEGKTGVSRRTLGRAEEHVTAGERHPFLQGPAWSQSGALKAGKLMDTMPAADRRKISAMVVESDAPPTDAVKMIESFSLATAEVRKKVYGMFRSRDERDRELAVTHLAKTAPIPDSRAVYLFKIAKQLKVQAVTFKEDTFNARIEAIGESANKLAERIMEQQKKRAKGLS